MPRAAGRFSSSRPAQAHGSGQKGDSMRIALVIGLSTLAIGCSTEPAPEVAAAAPALLSAPFDARACGALGSGCDVLGQPLDGARSISRVLPDGTFFVGTSGNAQTDLFGELSTNVDSDSSTIYRYTEATGLEPWITHRPSQLMLLYDVGLQAHQLYQAGINGVEIRGDHLYYTILYNAGRRSYERRARSFTAETGITFAELRRVRRGVHDPGGRETVLADFADAELAYDNPDGVLFPEADALGHQPGDPVYAINPYGLLPRGDGIWVADAAANDLFRIGYDGSRELVTVFPNRLQAQEPVPTKVFRGPGHKLYVTLFFCVNAQSSEALGGVARIREGGDFRMVSFNRLPISGAFGPDGHLYVLELADMFAPGTGRVLRTLPEPYDDYDGRPVSDGEVVVDHLDYPVDFAFDPAGRLVIVEAGTLDPFATAGRLIRVELP